MAKPLDLDTIRKMDGPQPERWIPILCDEIERISYDFAIAIGMRDTTITNLEADKRQLIEDITVLLKKYSKLE